jgi:transcription antitermination protein NusB
MGIRRKARECALQLLFQYDFTHDTPGEILQRYWEMQGEQPRAVKRSAEFFFQKSLELRPEIDDWIRNYTRHWPMDRMSVVDRNILRLAVTEFLAGEEPQAVIIINEALEMARSFSGEESVRFINGILDAIHLEMKSRKAGTV